MELISFSRDRYLLARFKQFPEKLYRNDRNWAPYMVQNQAFCFDPEFSFYKNPKNRFQHFILFCRDEVIGRVTAFINIQMLDEFDQPVNGFGFFECIADYAAAERLLRGVEKWFRRQGGADKIWGPINFDWWHGYRLSVNPDRAPFMHEPYNKSYYSEFFEDYGFYRKAVWSSFYLPDLPQIRRLADNDKGCLTKLKIKGYVFRSLQPGCFVQDMHQIYEILEKSCAGCKRVMPISKSDFLRIFCELKKIIDPELFTIVHDIKGDPVGFVFALRDWAYVFREKHHQGKLAAWRARRQNTRMIQYRAMIIPEHLKREPHLVKAMVVYNLKRILDLGATEVSLALIASRDKSMSLLSDSRYNQTGTYILYEYEL